MKDGVLAPRDADERARAWDGPAPATVRSARVAPLSDGEREAAWDGGAPTTMRDRNAASPAKERAAWKGGDRESLLGDSDDAADDAPKARAGWDAELGTMKQDDGPPSRRAMWMDAGP